MREYLLLINTIQYNLLVKQCPYFCVKYWTNHCFKFDVINICTVCTERVYFTMLRNFLSSGISVHFLFLFPLLKFFEIKFPFVLCHWISSSKFLTLCFKWSQGRDGKIGYSFCASWYSAFPGSDVDLKCFSKTFNIIASSHLDHDFFSTDFCFETRSFVPINSMKSIYFKQQV